MSQVQVAKKQSSLSVEGPNKNLQEEWIPNIMPWGLWAVDSRVGLVISYTAWILVYWGRYYLVWPHLTRRCISEGGVTSFFQAIHQHAFGLKQTDIVSCFVITIFCSFLGGGWHWLEWGCSWCLCTYITTSIGSWYHAELVWQCWVDHQVESALEPWWCHVTWPSKLVSKQDRQMSIFWRFRDLNVRASEHIICLRSERTGIRRNHTGFSRLYFLLMGLIVEGSKNLYHLP